MGLLSDIITLLLKTLSVKRLFLNAGLIFSNLVKTPAVHRQLLTNQRTVYAAASPEQRSWHDRSDVVPTYFEKCDVYVAYLKMYWHYRKITSYQPFK